MAEDTLNLKNGEVLKGTLLRVADGFYYFKSSSFGDLKIEADKVLPAPPSPPKHEPTSPTMPLDPAKSSLRPPGPPNGPPEKEGPPPPTPDQAFLRRLLHIPRDLHVELNLGLDVMDGQNTGESLTTALSMNYDKGRYFNSAGAEYQYAKVNGERNADRYEVKYRLVRYFGSPGHMRYFSVIYNTYEHDAIRLLDYDYNAYVGLGLDVYRSPRIMLRAAAGPNFEFRNFNGLPAFGILDLPSTRTTKVFAYEEFQYRPLPFLSIEQFLLYKADPSETRNYDIRATLGIKSQLDEHFSLTVQYQYTFDNSSPTGISQKASQLTSSLGYSF